LENKITLHLAPALETLPKFADDFFDVVFVDADKGNYQNYIDAAARLLRVGGLLMVDNTLWSGEVVDEHTIDKVTRTIQGVNNKLAADPRFQSVILPIGDGLTVAIKI
jgi:predicted O-methyltransferase YrrM